MSKRIYTISAFLFALLLVSAQPMTAQEAAVNEELSLSRLPSMAFPNQKGPIRVREQFPLNLPFLNFAPEAQFFLPKGRILLDISYSQVNTFAGTTDIQNRRTNGVRKPFLESDFDELIARKPGKDQYFLDMETSRISFLFVYGLTDDLQVDVEIPYLSFGGGFQDGLIENFHDTFGLGQDGRESFHQNDTTFALFLDGNKLFRSSFAYAGVGDVVVSAKLPIYGGGKFAPMLGVRLSLKLPTGDPDRLLGSGNVDYGFNFTSSFAFDGSSLHTNFGAVFPGGWDLVPGLKPDPIYSVLVAWEFVPHGNPDISYLVQDLVQTPTFGSSTDTELSEVLHEISLGMKVDLTKNLRVTLALTENHKTLNNSPDIGFHVGLTTTCC